ncbi:IclR family transcriptional regulator [Mycolicibacterium smegmatis]|jgi:DNA-binding IclR family transcriptional regulator|uniref:IclR family regulatory protein n=3 Tax=Mycolicibacterium smegmatis TaxID=1772 RepID=I7GD01_MYCS2|nr:IclR family transcriptional regulator [Mycolicibacterium smegmatis]ABK72710.1 transcriptional regulator, IclR family protein [Mycolicibacterium smegmatis MC2 155]AFP40534.1 IclR family regulatory protein [Mycolicibacterium smegmatis MC2 155]AIU09269.1 IclR family transcriptional regulator [Mycolicibacterium smegmatis MC2 155]AIU15894.1 IclR family transcriptional regulator [Mycolicibacterium smegmatis]AIU22517.1 IclR family transcriptional regulator [Mycolicibacterium smegmatis]
MEIAGAQSAYRVLDVLTEVSLNPGATAGEVAKATNLTAPTAHRLLRVLCDRGFAIQNDAGKYVPGPQMRVLAGDRVDRAILEELGRPLLARLRDESTETVFLAVREGLQLTYLVVMTSSHSVQMYGEVGQQIPLHATSQGKVVLAFLPPGVGERIIDQLELARYTPSTITTAKELHEAMYEIRRDGYALNLEERELGVRSVAAPVLDPSGNVVASVCVGGPIFRFSEDDLRGKFARMVCGTAEAITAELRRRVKPVDVLDERPAQ